MQDQAPVTRPQAPALPEPIKPPTLPLGIRFKVQNEDGSISTVRTINIGTEEGEVLIPTVVDNRILSDDEAIEHFYKTGQHFGVYRTPEEAETFARYLSEMHGRALRQTPMQDILKGE